jgi:hypothetical protein
MKHFNLWSVRAGNPPPFTPRTIRSPMMIMMMIIVIVIQFNSILYYLYAESTATRPITDTAQGRYR